MDNPDNKYNYRVHYYACSCGAAVSYKEAPDTESGHEYNCWIHTGERVESCTPEPADFYSAINFVFETQSGITRKVM